MRRLSKISYVGSHISGDFTIKYMVKTVSLVTHLGNPSFLMQKRKPLPFTYIELSSKNKNI